MLKTSFNPSTCLRAHAQTPQHLRHKSQIYSTPLAFLEEPLTDVWAPA